MASLKAADQIYASFLELCRAGNLPGLWSRFSSVNVFATPADCRAVHSVLCNQFGDAELKSVGLEDLLWRPGSSDDPSWIIPFRGRKSEAPSDLMTENGCVSGSLPLQAVAQDHSKLPSFELGSTKLLCVASTMADAAVLRSIGLRSTLALGLDTVAGDELHRLCRQYGWSTPHRVKGKVAGREPRCCNPPEIILVGWSPATLDRNAPAGMSAVCDHLRDLSSHLKIGLSSVSVWTPSTQEHARIEFCLKNGSLGHLQEAVSVSLENTKALIPGPGDTRPPDRQRSVALLKSHRPGLDGKDREAKLWRDVEETIDRDVIEPLRRAAMSSTDPMRRNQSLMAAETSRLLQLELARQDVLLARSVRDSGLEHCGSIPTASIEQMKSLLTQIRNLLPHAFGSGRPAAKSAAGGAD